MPGETEETLKRFNRPVTGPSRSGVPPGETGGPGTTGSNEQPWIGPSQSAAEYYAPGGQGTTNLNISNPNYPNYVGPPPNDGEGGNGGGNITGSGATGGDDITRSSFFTPSLDLIDGGPKFGFDNFMLWNKMQDEATANQHTPQYTQNLITNEPAEVNLMPTIPTDNTGWDLNPLPGQGGSGIGYQGDNFSFGLDVDPNINLGNMSINPSATANLKLTFNEGGPVGEPEIDQSGIASLYPAQLFSLEEQPREPFGATRENVGEQLEAWRNAPHHVDPPNIGFMGEQVPAPLFDRAMKYLDSLPPSERAVIEEMFRENIMRKRMEEAQQMQELQSVPTLDV